MTYCSPSSVEILPSNRPSFVTTPTTDDDLSSPESTEKYKPFLRTWNKTFQEQRIAAEKTNVQQRTQTKLGENVNTQMYSTGPTSRDGQNTVSGFWRWHPKLVGHQLLFCALRLRQTRGNRIYLGVSFWNELFFLEHNDKTNASALWMPKGPNSSKTYAGKITTHCLQL